jgi:glycosyltransferase involved in cell wall biosynthesis
VPLISIIVATRNAAATLPRCLASIRAQSFRDFELIVMDAASTDGTVELLESGSDFIAAWRSEPDRGIYHAWNKALELSRGEWICFLGADDWLWDDRVLEALAPYLRSVPAGCRIVYSRLRQVDAGGAVVAEAGVPWAQAKRAFRSYRCLPQPGLMHHRSLFAAHGGFDETLRIAADYEFLLRELKDRDALFAPVLMVGAALGGLTTRPENFFLMQREIGQAVRRHGLKLPRVRWAWWMLSGWLYLRLRALVGDNGARRVADLYRLLSLRKPRYAGRRDQ